MCGKRVTLLLFVVFAGLLLSSAYAGSYTSEETDEKTKSLYSAVTSILGTSDTSKHHHKHTYDGGPAPCSNGGGCPVNVPGFVQPGAALPPPPCSNGGGCSVNVPGFVQPGSAPPPPASSCSAAGGCPPLTKTTTYGNGIVYPSPSPNVIHGAVQPAAGVPAANGHYTYGHGTPAQPPKPAGGAAYGSYAYGGYPQATGPVAPAPIAAPPAQPQPAYGYSGYGPVPAGYVAPPQGGSGAYGYHQPAAGHPGHYGYQGDRGYSVYDHSLKLNSEYTEVGTHNGPLQRANGGYGYGSGFGGYNGLFNRPGF
uniref:VM domain-containing protein n=1 Tax=Musca domestica TaxID=7370 RepID=A0A1I8NJ78_MUSDO